MIARKLMIAVLFLGLMSRGTWAQNFTTSNWVGRPSSGSSHSHANHQMPTRPAQANRPATSWAERDPRNYRAVSNIQPASYRTPISNLGATAYRAPAYGGCQSASYSNGFSGFPNMSSTYAYPAAPYAAGPYATSPYSANTGYRNSVPRGYYRGDGLFGKDTVYAKDQPLRNVFRFLLP